MKKAVIVFLVMLLSGTIPLRADAETSNLVKNGSFEKVSRGLPERWMMPGYGRERANIKVYLEKNGAFAGDRFVTIHIFKASEGRLIQFVKVQPGRIYKISCRVKAEGIGSKGKGAYISVLNSPAASRDYKDTGGDWLLVEFFGRTGPEQYEIAAALRLAGSGSLNKGKASFDDFRIEEVTNIPRGSKIVNLYTEIAAGPESVSKTPRKSHPVTGITFLLIGLMLPFLGIYYFLLKQYKIPFTPNPQSEMEPGAVEPGYGRLSPQVVFFIFLSAAFLLRIILAPVIEGYPTDIACFKGWALLAAEKGLPGFYLSDAFVDYPPGYIYILYIIGLLRKLFSLSYDSAAFLILIKLPAIIADIITALIIFRVGKKEAGFATASFLSLIYAFNPAVIFDSTVYGQVDSIFVLLLFGSLVLVYKDKLPAAAVVFVLAVLVKPQTLIFSPVLLYAFIKKKSLKDFFSGVFFALVTFVIVILPFSISQGPWWIVDLYKKTLSSYPYASLNAFNLYALFGGNWAAETGTFLLFSYRTWGFIFIAAVVVFSALLYFKSRDKSGIFFTAMFIMAAVFVLSSKMHERYLFPTVLLALSCYVYARERRMLFLFWGFTFTLLINVAMVLHFILNRSLTAVPKGDFLLRFISLVNVCLLVYIIITGINKYIKNK